MITPKRRQCRWREPALLVDKLVQEWGEAGLVWLDGDGSNLGRWVTLAVDPIQQICCRGLPGDTTASDPFEELRHLEPGHWSGWLSYEAGAWIEPNNPWKRDPMATLWIASHDPVLRFDLIKRQLWLEGCNNARLTNFEKWLKVNLLDIESKDNETKYFQSKEIGISLEEWKWLTNLHDYVNGVKQIQNWIASGDIFQANLSACCTTKFLKENYNVELFQKLRQHCPAPFGGLVIGAGKAAGEAVISCSPERFLNVLPTGQIETRPIKGTRPRNPNVGIDADMAADLICSAKDRAENIMIVDLLRNDLGRVCIPGSIKVPQLVGLESFAQVHHLTSVIQGQLRSEFNWVDLLKACWPGGSISGAPKLRACQRLNELEPVSRGPYCGSLLRLDWNCQLDSSILIRSLIRKRENLRVYAGCGIVIDSQPLQEAEELKWKLIPLLKALQ